MGPFLDFSCYHDRDQRRPRRRLREYKPIRECPHKEGARRQLIFCTKVIYSKGYVVLVTFLATSFLAFTLSLALFYKLWPSPPTSQKFAVLVENYFLSWVVLVFGTIAVNRLQIGGAYLLTAWNLCAWLAATIALVEAVVRAKWTSTHGGKPDLDVVDDSEPIPDDPPTGHRFVRGVMYRPAAQRRDSQGGLEEEGEAVETDPTEITPLMQQQRRRSTGGGEYIIGVDNEPLRIDGNKKRDRVHDEYGWWIFQMLGLIPLPAMLLFQVLLIMMHALRNTMADGSSPIVGTPAFSVSWSLFILG